MAKLFDLGSRVKTKTIKPKSNFNKKYGVVVEHIDIGPFSYRVKFDSQVISGGVPFDDMFFEENELELISEGS